MIAASVLVFLVNALRTAQTPQTVGANPWDAPTLDWATPSPPPVYNFRVIPVVTHRDQLWHDRYDRAAQAAGRPDAVADAIVAVDQVPQRSPVGAALTAVAEAEGPIHMPNPSYYPLVTAIGLFLLPFGLLVNNPHIQLDYIGVPIISAIGLLTLFVGVYGWSFEPAG
jgi:hypothetical protein